MINKGLLKSIYRNSPITKNFEAIPWLTHPLIEFISKLNLKNLSMLEYGAGNSTIFFRKYVKDIVSFEYSEKWVSTLRLRHNYHGLIHLVDEQYGGTISDFENKDLILVDGFDRNAIISNLINYIKTSKVLPELLVIDNINWLDSDLLEELITIGYVRIDFYGIVSQLWDESITSLFISRKIDDLVFRNLADNTYKSVFSN
jgi:hypothetical protein